MAADAHGLPWRPTSHWDRLPRELQVAVLDTAGPRTKLAVGFYGDAASGSPEPLRAMLADMLRLDPAPMRAALLDVAPAELQCIDARPLFDAVAAAMVRCGADARPLRLVALRRGWLDAVDAMPPTAIVDAALAAEAEAGVFEALVTSQRVAADTALLEAVARRGRLDVLRCVERHAARGAWTSGVLTAAAASGNDAAVAWLLDTHAGEPTPETLVAAAGTGRTAVVRLLRARAPASGGVDAAVLMAAIGGHMGVLEALAHECDAATMQRAACAAAGNSQAPALAWLHSRDPATITADTLAAAARAQTDRSLALLFNMCPHLFTPESVDAAIAHAAAAAQLPCVLWLRRTFSVAFAASPLALSGGRPASPAIDWIAACGCVRAEAALAAAVASDRADAVEWLLEHMKRLALVKRMHAEVFLARRGGT
ncbi:hypothetical protein HK105_208391 [Polyrhizophydium stewartii]|uniref:Ankyrin repeat domain-containing protein n=1 Tax=Polyrhizophydium stewartii TaxID=2732419 RepID=A0ABR4MY03_9FUNG|nr:hypothetical protein HK105_005746 [Polyrhizophydium stewartii]